MQDNCTHLLRKDIEIVGGHTFWTQYLLWQWDSRLEKMICLVSWLQVFHSALPGKENKVNSYHTIEKNNMIEKNQEKQTLL